MHKILSMFLIGVHGLTAAAPAAAGPEAGTSQAVVVKDAIKATAFQDKFRLTQFDSETTKNEKIFREISNFLSKELEDLKMRNEFKESADGILISPQNLPQKLTTAFNSFFTKKSAILQKMMEDNLTKRTKFSSENEKTEGYKAEYQKLEEEYQKLDEESDKWFARFDNVRTGILEYIREKGFEIDARNHLDEPGNLNDQGWFNIASQIANRNPLPSKGTFRHWIKDTLTNAPDNLDFLAQSTSERACALASILAPALKIDRMRQILQSSIVAEDARYVYFRFPKVHLPDEVKKLQEALKTMQVIKDEKTLAELPIFAHYFEAARSSLEQVLSRINPYLDEFDKIREVTYQVEKEVHDCTVLPLSDGAYIDKKCPSFSPYYLFFNMVGKALLEDQRKLGQDITSYTNTTNYGGIVRLLGLTSFGISKVTELKDDGSVIALLIDGTEKTYMLNQTGFFAISTGIHAVSVYYDNGKWTYFDNQTLLKTSEYKKTKDPDGKLFWKKEPITPLEKEDILKRLNEAQAISIVKLD